VDPTMVPEQRLQIRRRWVGVISRASHLTCWSVLLTHDVRERATGKWEVGTGKQPSSVQDEQGLIVRAAAKHHAITSPFKTPINTAGKDLVIQ